VNAKSFVTTDRQGQFLLHGQPWFLHGATYFGRRPGTCVGSWFGENFQHNFEFLKDDVHRMRDIGLNTVSLFLPGADFYDAKLQPEERIFRQLDLALDVIAAAGLRSVIFPCTRITRETWCKVHGIEPGPELWNPSVNRDAEKSLFWTYIHFARRYARRNDVLGYMGRVGRFDFKDWDPPEALASPVYTEWYAWLERRFHGDFALARELLDLETDETRWDRIRLPQETPQHFSRTSSRAFEYGVMQQVLVSQANQRLHRLIKDAAPDQFTINDMEGCEFAISLLNVLVPELVTADAIWLECYNWEGMRGSHDTSPRHQTWLVEPSAEKPTIELIGNAGYVQMLIRWMQQSGKALILCHGTDIGNRRGVRNENEQALMVDRFNAYIQACGAHAINYWCWTDDEQSRTVKIPEGVEVNAETVKQYGAMDGESMGILRFDGGERPLTAVIRGTSPSLIGQPSMKSPKETLVLFPTPIFQSLYRYRANCTGFGVFTSLARQGILADAAFTSAGEDLIAPERLEPYRLIILGTASYERDHPEIADLLLNYVEQGGTLFIPLAFPDRIDDAYLKSRHSAALEILSGKVGYHSRGSCRHLAAIRSHHPRFVTDLTRSWTLGDEALFTRVSLPKDVELLASADDFPLLYRHSIGKGTVYLFTWTLDVHLFRDTHYDYPGGNWDWLWQGLSMEMGLLHNAFNPMTRAIREMTYHA